MVLYCFDKASPKFSACENCKCLHDSLHIEEGEIDEIKNKCLQSLLQDNKQLCSFVAIMVMHFNPLNAELNPICHLLALV